MGWLACNSEHCYGVLVQLTHQVLFHLDPDFVRVKIGSAKVVLKRLHAVLDSQQGHQQLGQVVRSHRQTQQRAQATESSGVKEHFVLVSAQREQGHFIRPQLPLALTMLQEAGLGFLWKIWLISLYTSEREHNTHIATSLAAAIEQAIKARLGHKAEKYRHFSLALHGRVFNQQPQTHTSAVLAEHNDIGLDEFRIEVGVLVEVVELAAVAVTDHKCVVLVPVQSARQGLKSVFRCLALLVLALLSGGCPCLFNRLAHAVHEVLHASLQRQTCALTTLLALQFFQQIA